MAWRSVAAALDEFLSAPARAPKVEGLICDDGPGWTNGRIVEALCGARGADARDPALYDAVRLRTDRPAETFRQAFAACARGARGWVDFDFSAIRECHPAFEAMELPESAEVERRDFEDTILSKKGAMFSSKTPEWRTPASVLDRVRRVGPIALDPCAHPQGLVRAAREIRPPGDGLAEEWGVSAGEGLVYVNPPYGRVIVDWCGKCAIEHIERGSDVIGLLPARTDTSWFHEAIFEVARMILFWRGRIRFLADMGEVDPAPFPSAVVLWTRSDEIERRFGMAFWDAGHLVRL